MQTCLDKIKTAWYWGRALTADEIKAASQDPFVVPGCIVLRSED